MNELEATFIPKPDSLATAIFYRVLYRAMTPRKVIHIAPIESVVLSIHLLEVSSCEVLECDLLLA
jgi:hypothetical protein